MPPSRRAPGFLGRALRVLGFVLATIAIMFVVALGIDTVGTPVSTLMLARLATGHSYRRDWVPLTAIAPVAIASVIASEDARFCQNDGVDWSSLEEVLDERGANGPSRGASTITMQTAKNLFLWPSRSAIRKGIEIGIALLLGKLWTKPHVLEVYLNIAEWGNGLYGIEAASRRYFTHSARQLTAREAALLATALPNPIERVASDPQPFQRRLAANLMARTAHSTEWLDCLPRRSRYGD